VVHKSAIGYTPMHDRRRREAMIHTRSHLLLTLVLSAGAGVAMARIGVQSKLLEWRSRIRRCPACGRLCSGVCRNCAG
jgi:hypothetical protein